MVQGEREKGGIAVAPHPRACDFADISVEPISKYLRHLRLHEEDSKKITEITKKLDRVEKFGCRLEKLVELFVKRVGARRRRVF